ncbi:MAG: hypothetical protein FJZ88_03645, partial [Chloroflexi bacterium]|nr:hypothetical protein [Chloroflexota bacterium]
MKTKWWQGSLFYLLILVAIIALAFSFFPVNKAPKEVDYYTFVNKARDGEIDTIEQNGTALTGLKNGEKVAKSSFVGSTKELMDTLKESGIALGEGGVKFLVKTGGFDWGSVMISFLPLILFGALLFFLFRSARGANTQAFNFARSRAL